MSATYCIKLVATDRRNDTFKQQDWGLWHGYAVDGSNEMERWITQDINEAHYQCASFRCSFLSASVEEYVV